MNTKVCTVCDTAKDVGEFFVRKASRDGLAPLCKVCDTLKRKLRKLADPEKERQYQREYRLRNLDQKRESDRAYYWNNKESFLEKCADRYAQNKDQITRRFKRYYASSKPDFVARATARKTAQRIATPRWADLDAIRDIYRLCESISRETGVRHHVDHEIPLKGKLVCGLHVHTNLRIIPALDNMRKKNHFAVE